jgi:hypothetical protein
MRRVGRLPATVRAEPSGTCPSRLVTVLLRVDDGEPLAPGDAGDAGVPPADEATGAAGGAAGLDAAMPHTSQ